MLKRSWKSFSEQIKLVVSVNFSGSNTFGTMKIYSRQGWFELMCVNQSARSGGIIRIYFRFALT